MHFQSTIEKLPLPKVRFVAIDFESAPSTDGHEPIQIGWAAMEEGQIDSQSCFEQNLRLRNAAAIDHKYPNLFELWPVIEAALRGNCIVAHGAGTERRFLRAFPGHRFGPWIDTLQLARAVWPDQSSHTLENLCNNLNLTAEIYAARPSGHWHQSLFDSIAALILLRQILIHLNDSSLTVAHLTVPRLKRYTASRRGLKNN